MYLNNSKEFLNPVNKDKSTMYKIKSVKSKTYSKKVSLIREDILVPKKKKGYPDNIILRQFFKDK